MPWLQYEMHCQNIKFANNYGNHFLESKTLDSHEFDAQMLRVFWLGTKLEKSALNFNDVFGFAPQDPQTRSMGITVGKDGSRLD